MFQISPPNEHKIEESSLFTKDFCPFCYEEVGHFSRHLLRKHADEELVKKISNMPLKSKDRRTAIVTLRKKGFFLLKNERNELKPVRRPVSSFSTYPNKDTTNLVDRDNYVPCINCLGFYKKTYLWRHKKICKSRITSENENGRKQHLTDVQTFLAITGALGNFLNKSRLKDEVFCIMRPDKISLTAKQDPLICLYGESLISKHKRKQMAVVVSNKIREIARLKLVLQNSTNISNLIDLLKPDMYDYIVAASKIVCGYNPETKQYKASSLAMHLGTSLKFLCQIAKKAIFTNHFLFAELVEKDRKKKIERISELEKLIKHHWCNDVSSLANKVLNENKSDKPKLLPVTEDIKIFNNYVTHLAYGAYDQLKSLTGDVVENYKILCECTLTLTVVFNRKRIGEVQFLDINTYEKDMSKLSQEECLSSLTEFEKVMSSCFKRVVVFGKGSKPVPILFTKQIQCFINVLLSIRKTKGIVPVSNSYLFANPGSENRWMNGSSVLRKMAYNCGAKQPELLTSTRFRKQIATILQLMSLQKDEIEQIARFMGHTEKTHLEFYR